MKNYNDNIGNRTRYLPTCSTVTQLRHRVLPYFCRDELQFFF